LDLHQLLLAGLPAHHPLIFVLINQCFGRYVV
jgi:hypothetical protein